MAETTDSPDNKRKLKLKSTIASLQAMFRRRGMLSETQRRAATIKALRDMNTRQDHFQGWEKAMAGRKDDDNVL